MAAPNAPVEASSVAELLADATDREPITDGAGKSGARLERVRIEGVSHVVKYVDLDSDWTMRTAGCLVPAALLLWRRGVFTRLPACIDQPIIGVAAYERGAALLMRDVADVLVPVSDDPIDLPTQHQFLDHMAAMHAAFWDAGPECDVVPTSHRYLDLSPWLAQAEGERGSDDLVPRLVGQGWPLLAEVAPVAAAVVTPLAWDPGPLVMALADTPQTFVHGNWKFDNLGVHEDGRTVLLDWELPGRSPGLSDLAWYLSINCRRLPESKEATIATYRAALERHGIDTAPWWDRQLALCLLGGLVQFGWEKAFGGYDDELAWWEARALEGAELL
ncbi:phosphotransferase [Sporichthya sp.]|uniref:phosphotransferase n=1 Tax=Sporichthya sp. TaxID=65475 RepID=UPI0017909E69|nr:phosphotransferase [Sporichthya sp.]MBA3743677.1 aminoglycoside phosphotransferase [Sporichthya sp.]